jgi:Fanconi anemia group M protein
MEEKKALIYVDSRERCTSILDYLRKIALIEITTLPVGDYILSDRVVVERKTVEDFLSSLMDKRLFAQAIEMKRNFSSPILIIEGTDDIYSLRGINENAIRGAIASLSIDYGIGIIRTENETDTAKFLHLIAKREQLDENRPVSLRGEKKPALLEEKQRFILESLPNVSSVLAKRLLERFGSVQNVINASKKELGEVAGIGEGKAEEIVTTIRSRYKT